MLFLTVGSPLALATRSAAACNAGLGHFAVRASFTPPQNAGYRTKGVIHIFRSAELDSHVRFQNHNIGSSGITSCMLSPHTLAEVVFRTHGVFV